MLQPGSERFTADDLVELSELVCHSWASSANHDWSAQAGTVEWSCTATADHAVDCVYAPAFFLASRRTDAYPYAGSNLEMGDQATPARLVESLAIATRLLIAVVRDSPDDVRAIIFKGPEPMLGAPADFLPRAAAELILHAHDVSVGLGIEFEPSAAIARRLREHTRPWPMWTMAWNGLGSTDDPWGDLLAASDRTRPEPGAFVPGTNAPG
jgi:hypothetical protein